MPGQPAAQEKERKDRFIAVHWSFGKDSQATPDWIRAQLRNRMDGFDHPSNYCGRFRRTGSRPTCDVLVRISVYEGHEVDEAVRLALKRLAVGHSMVSVQFTSKEESCNVNSVYSAGSCRAGSQFCDRLGLRLLLPGWLEEPVPSDNGEVLYDSTDFLALCRRLGAWYGFTFFEDTLSIRDEHDQVVVASRWG
ncbi:hypothetical protein S7711_11517 [Stachybotrys chartarum IBT 7711]|uniref:Uncharacterized protein n=1 Tax=Stachybotrys chartarum (strain CBS 109288 / IBT 7711) TaxID=1280523 RepID=A0A084B8R3_STACB|nr:hypothetical protein S7711_11517 [Stachybotrys chartarum IBT 7711]KFA79430.1 hypothetical protein S40288_11627 [Stachybotrys chartarum IBT 40288]